MRVSIILPVINETFSLRQTVDIIFAENKENIFEILIITAKITTDESMAIINELINKHPDIIKHHRQTLPFLGGAMQEAFDLTQGDYTILMASDLETDPHTVKDLINKIKQGYDIVACSRWIKKDQFSGYNPVKLILNKIFQIFFRVLFGTKLTDLTFAYRIYKTNILKKIKWEESKHPFLFECIIKPLKLGFSVVEIPSSWQARKEGVSQNTFMQNFVYFRIGLKVFFTSKDKLLK